MKNISMQGQYFQIITLKWKNSNFIQVYLNVYKKLGICNRKVKKYRVGPGINPRTACIIGKWSTNWLRNHQFLVSVSSTSETAPKFPWLDFFACNCTSLTSKGHWNVTKDLLHFTQVLHQLSYSDYYIHPIIFYFFMVLCGQSHTKTVDNIWPSIANPSIRRATKL